jgi:hypothetical protein
VHARKNGIKGMAGSAVSAEGMKVAISNEMAAEVVVVNDRP